MLQNFTYYFILGHSHNLSIAEIINILHSYKVQYSIIASSQYFLLINVDQKIESLMSNLGGTIKYGIIFDESNEINDIQDKIIENVNSIQHSQKYFFSIIAYSNKGLTNSSKISSTIKHNLDLNKGSKYFEQRDISAVLTKKILDNKGEEFIYFYTQNKYYLGKTLWCHDFKQMKNIEFDRPKWDKESGMLPIKLSQIMINLTKVNNTKTIWDPFCGSGTIILSGMNSGKNVIGTDISDKAVEDTKNNVSWLVEDSKSTQSNSEKGNESFTLIDKTSINSLTRIFKDLPLVHKNGISFVTEPYLGPTLRKVISPERLNQILPSVMNNILLFFDKVYHIEKSFPNSIESVIIVIPFYKTYKGYQTLNISRSIKKMSKIGLVHPRWINQLEKIIPNFELMWYRKNSIIRRKILILQKAK